MVYGKIENDKFEYSSDMAYVYFLSDGFVYTAFNKKVPSGWESVTETDFVLYTREMYADSLTWGVGKPLIQLANKDRYGLVCLSDDYRSNTSDKAASSKAVYDAYNALLELYGEIKSSNIASALDFETLKYAKHSNIETTIDEDGNITERLHNMMMHGLTAEKNTIFISDNTIMESVVINNPLAGGMPIQYITNTTFSPNGDITVTNN